MIWSFYDQQTGLFTGRQRRSAQLGRVPDGCGAVEGAYDHLSQRVELSSGQVVDYQPPRPDDDHEWREDVVNGRPRWVKRDDVLERERLAAEARREIDRLERSQLRAMRELAIDPTSVEAKQRLQQIDDEIAAKRPALKQ